MLIETFEDYIEVLQKTSKGINGTEIDGWVLEEQNEILHEQFRVYKENGVDANYDEVRNIITFLDEEYS